MRRTIGTVAALAVALLAVGGGAATAAKLVTGAGIKDGSITLKDLSKGTKTALKGAQGARGATGPQGPAGPAGAAGVPGVSGSTKVTQAFGQTLFLCPADPQANCDIGISVARCPAGTVATGGGWGIGERGLLDATVGINSSTVDGRGWIVGALNHGATPADFFTVVHCIPGTVAGPVPNGVTAREAEARLRAAP
jgi:hypothetical protein